MVSGGVLIWRILVKWTIYQRDRSTITVKLKCLRLRLFMLSFLIFVHFMIKASLDQSQLWFQRDAFNSDSFYSSVSCRELWWVWSETCEALRSPLTPRRASWCCLTGCILTADLRAAYVVPNWTELFIIHHNLPKTVLNPDLQISGLHAHSAASHRALVPRPSMHHACSQTNGWARPQQVNTSVILQLHIQMYEHVQIRAVESVQGDL